jgi:hypothetical protein
MYLSEYHQRLVTSIVKKRYNPKTKKSEYCLVSVKDPKKILKWFGSNKPSDERVIHEEKRVQYFKNKKP